MMTDPEQHCEPWCGTCRLICVFEVGMDAQDDASTTDQAGDTVQWARPANRQIQTRRIG